MHYVMHYVTSLGGGGGGGRLGTPPQKVIVRVGGEHPP